VEPIKGAAPSDPPHTPYSLENRATAQFSRLGYRSGAEINGFHPGAQIPACLMVTVTRVGNGSCTR